MRDKLEKIFDSGSNIEKIIVRDVADKDCFLATSIMLAAMNYSRTNEERKEVAVYKGCPAEDIDAHLTDPSVILIGVGGTDSTALRSFDVVQSDTVHGLSCTGQVLRYLDLYDVAHSHYSWLEYYDTCFTKNPASYAVRAADKLSPNCTDELLDFSIRLSKKLSTNITSPIETYVLAEFNNQTVIANDNISYNLMERLGKGILRGLEGVQEVGGVLEKCEVFFVSTPEDPKAVKVFDSTDVIPGKQNSTGYVNQYLNEHIHDVSVVISNDTRGEGISFFRRNENPNIDFSKLNKEPGVVYAASEGQLVKTSKKLNLTQKVQFIEKALL